MPVYRNDLPQRHGGLFLTDGGIETFLMFHEGRDLPSLAAFHLLRDETGRDALRNYFLRYIPLATENHAGFVLESPTWRASPDWGRKLGYTPEELAAANQEAIRLLTKLRDRHETARSPMVISGCVGPRGDGYDPGDVMTPEEAEAYHSWQIGVFAKTEADMVTAITMTSAAEAIGVARAARAAWMPCAISFTVETDGSLPTGQKLKEAIEEVDAATGAAPAWYMINCAHPDHFEAVLDGGQWMDRLRGLRANASRCSHAELDESGELDDGDPAELGEQYAELRARFPQINVLGGCCGTDHRHVAEIARQCLAGNSR